MKLTHQRMTNRYNNTPESILDWLEEQLENRGIDAVVYTRYILSLLQEDDNDFDDYNCNTSISAVTSDGSTGGIGNGIGFKFCCEHHFIRRQTHNNSCVKENIKPVTTNKWKHKRYLKSNTGYNNSNNCQHSRHQNLLSCHCCGNDMNTDEERKLAVVECLKSASEQEFGIESFVDELCVKLKNIKLLTERDISSEREELSIDCKTDSTNNPITVSPKEQAMKYFAAFPALDCGVNDEKSGIKTVLEKKVVVNKHKLGENKWNGQKIIEFMTNSLSNDGLLHGLTDETSRQTITTANNCPENSITKLEALNIDKQLEDVKIETKFDNNIINKEELIDKNSRKELINSLLKNNGNKMFVYCGDIEKNVLSNDNSLVFSKNINNNYDCNREESDKFQKLVEKFNSNIASIWSKTGDSNGFSSLTKNDNIWSFDSSFSSNQSSASPSPKLNTIDFWSTIGETESVDEISNTTPTVDQMISDLTPISWESSVLQSIGGISGGNAYNHSGSNDKNESWLLSDFLLNENINKTCAENNATITLRNHQENSPFIEFNSLMSSTPKQLESIADCLQLSAPLSSAFKSNNLTLPEENLLTSPKTHFQPIKQESFDRDSSDEESVSDMTDNEVNKLVICSAKCPNNADYKDIDSNGLKVRPFSTSLDELASFMGPFNDIDSTSNEFSGLTFDEELELEPESKNYKMSDKSTNTETETEMEVKPKLEPIIESSAENEPEYQDLCNMINEVLKNGLLEEDSNSTCGSSVRNMVSMDDWYDDDIGDNASDFITIGKREKRLSWNCYWDTYDTISDNVRSHQKDLFAIENESKNILTEDISGDKMRNRFALNEDSIEKNGNDSTVHECYDEVFDEQLFTRNSTLVNDFQQNYGQEFSNYCLPEENSYDIDWNAVHESYAQDLYINDIENCDDYLWNTNEGNDVISDESSDFGQPFRLQMKTRYNDVPKRHRKPCSFFIEGNCKRSDCKYSHDISNITCKYWEEGFCFKASLCPFLHGYITDSNFESDVSSAIMSKKSYTIESESDFPSLATLPNTEDDNNTIQEELEIFKKSVDHHFFDFRTKSVTDNRTTTSVTNRKLPIVVFMKKKVKKRKDRNLQ